MSVYYQAFYGVGVQVDLDEEKFLKDHTPEELADYNYAMEQILEGSLNYEVYDYFMIGDGYSVDRFDYFVIIENAIDKIRSGGNLHLPLQEHLNDIGLKIVSEDIDVVGGLFVS